MSHVYLKYLRNLTDGRHMSIVCFFNCNQENILIRIPGLPKVRIPGLPKDEVLKGLHVPLPKMSKQFFQTNPQQQIKNYQMSNKMFHLSYRKMVIEKCVYESNSLDSAYIPGARSCIYLFHVCVHTTSDQNCWT